MTVKEFDNLVARIMKEAKLDGEPVTVEEAKEMARMEMKAIESKTLCTAEGKPRKKRETKKDPEKLAIIKQLYSFLKENGFEDVTIANDTRQIDFGAFSLTLVKHKPKKV